MLLFFQIFVHLMLLTVNDSTDQWAFYNYDVRKSQATLEREIYKDRFWMQPDNSQGTPYFITKGDFKKGGKLKIIPVLKLSKGFKEYDYSKDIRDYYEVDYSQFCGLIFKGNKFLNIMFVTYAYDRKEQLIPVASLGDIPKKFYELYKQNADRYFYDITIQSFCFFTDNELFAWSNEKDQFIDYQQLIESEKFGLETFKKTVNGNE
jgi:hypothetical protein